MGSLWKAIKYVELTCDSVERTHSLHISGVLCKILFSEVCYYADCVHLI